MGERSTPTNAFTSRRTAELLDLTTDMLVYLARQGHLVPHYGGPGRGKARHYSYRDLLVGGVAARLLAAGVEIAGMPKAFSALARRGRWPADPGTGSLHLLVAAGGKLGFVNRYAAVEEALGGGPCVTLVDVERVRGDLLARMTAAEAHAFDLRNLPLRYGPRGRGAGRRIQPSRAPDLARTHQPAPRR